MNLTLSAEQQELRETVAKFLHAKAPVSALRAIMETEAGFDPGVWSQLCEQMGLVGLLVPESLGGMGCGPVELALVLHEMGRVLYSGPYLATALAVTALMRSGDERACAELLPDLATGDSIGTLAFAEANGDWRAGPQLRTTARQVGQDWLVDGVKTFVLGVPAADLFLVTARTAEGVGLFAVRASYAVDVEVQPALDLSRRLGTVRFTAAPAQLIGIVGQAESIVDGVLDVAAMAVAAEQAGAAWQCLEMSVEYAKTRTQFGVPIGSHQAVAHKCAEMLLLAEHTRSAAQYAAAAAGSPEFPIAAHAAAAFAGPAFSHISTETIQVHGGIGFTWEHDAHLYYRRAQSSALLFGHTDTHYAAVADHAGL
ncbi:MAG TPA: acyl-CoA dehydrogenase [Micromonosporaceae bacterium]|nr:acyl-CoA dehydrogenase [Micromonosporaceae bacterium]HCU50997.1 acyl-CoA dehydrogenase [Micromonosporaceae bacterium]